MPASRARVSGTRSEVDLGDRPAKITGIGRPQAPRLGAAKIAQGPGPGSICTKDQPVPEGRLRRCAPARRHISRPSGTPDSPLPNEPTDRSVGYSHRAPPGRPWQRTLAIGDDPSIPQIAIGSLGRTESVDHYRILDVLRISVSAKRREYDRLCRCGFERAVRGRGGCRRRAAEPLRPTGRTGP